MTVYYVDKDGKFLGGFDSVEPPVEAVREVPPPVNGKDRWNFDTSSWEPVGTPVSELRRLAYHKELGNHYEQLNAICSALETFAEKLGVAPDPDCPVNTLPGYLGKIQEIKLRYPKEG